MPYENPAPDIAFPNLSISFQNVPRYLIGSDPDASLIYFSRFPLNIHLYAVCIVIGLSAAIFFGMWHVIRTGKKVDDYIDLLLLGIPMALVGLRLYYVIFNWSRYSGQNFFRVFIDFRGGGLAIYGGIIGAALAAAITGWRKNIPFSVIADVGAPSMLIGQVVGRFGNFFNREAFGGFTEGLFAMRVRTDQTRALTSDMLERLENARVTEYGVEYFQVHPTFFYEAFFNALLMVGLFIYRPRKKFDGEIVLLYFMGYGIVRFFVEGLRTDQMMLGTIALNQLVAAGFALVSLALIIMGHMRERSRFPLNRRRK